ncbi:MAG: extracellular solute-binding protein [Clostridiales bacterium]|nr:extracellular solute-binding protein [Clostridiales bacterium]
MKKISKLLLSITTTALIAGNVMAMSSCSFLPGAGGGNNDDYTNTKVVTGSVNSVAYDGSEVTISFYHTMGEALRTILDNHIVRFNELYPNIKVVHNSYGDYPGVRDQITTEMSGNGTAPSLAYCYPDHVALYNKSKAVLTLDDFINNTEVGFTQEQINDFVPAYYNEGKVYGDDKMYTLPVLKSTEVLYYNKTYFEKNNYQVPTTWDDMETLLGTIATAEAAKGNKCIPLGYDSEANWFITMTEQLGTPYTAIEGDSHFLFNTAENRAFVERFRGWYQNDWVTTEELNGGTYTSNLFKETDPKKLHTYMSIGSSAGAGYQCPTKNNDGTYPFEVGIAMIPQSNPEDPKVISQGPSVCLFKKSNEQEMAAAWLFAKFLTTDIQLQGAMSLNNGYCSAVQSIMNNETYAKQIAKADGNARLQATVIKKTMEMRDYYYVSPAFHGSSAARDEVGLLIQTCFSKDPTGGQTVAQFIESEFAKSVSALSKRYDK